MDSVNGKITKFSVDWLDTKVDQWSQKEKGNLKPTKVDCQTEYHSKKEIEDIEEETGEKPKVKNTFRTRKFIAYEDRIRAYSTPDKIFRYFATLKRVDEDGTSEVFMTPDDFLRAITPGLKQPDGLDLDAFIKFDPKKDQLNLNIPKDSIFYCFGNNALISFTDFVFLLTVISTPQRQFEIAFRMFDINGDGELEASEFDVVRGVILDTTAMGRRHRDHSTTGSTLKSVSQSALHDYFFGSDGKQKLKISKFLEFQSRLQEEITQLEFKRLQQDTRVSACTAERMITPLSTASRFERYAPKEGRITEQAFAKSLLTYAGFSENKRRLMLRRVKKKFPEDDIETSVGITFKEFLDFTCLLRCVSELDTALTFHTLAGAAIDPATFLHVSKVVAHVELTPHLVDVVFTLFDENDDGQLSYKEFVQVMKNRLFRGLDKPMDTGFIRFLNAIVYCVQHEIRRRLD
ncbi:Calcium-binding atopy-related autoantigen [Echinococcus granulosus]|uniref:Calcium-binding atopy-related autoantigen n=1 Tax=Echinococcus granulosus TaxID=6210 RepID=W6UB29_ECHGR|nr:Calcium-binding atopy-related autoantigen [Echinococcus granulosus]EUB58588.1 Calcium-binding atopy-related autoantigen [Echinococcus granulosus]